jgi:hypothetical protein
MFSLSAVSIIRIYYDNADTFVFHLEGKLKRYNEISSRLLKVLGNIW